MNNNNNNTIPFPTPSAAQPLTMSSREIAALMCKPLKQVHRDIANLLKLIDGAGLHHHRYCITANYDARGYIAEYLLNKALTLLLITGYDVVCRAKIIDRWLELEEAIRKPASFQTSQTQL